MPHAKIDFSKIKEELEEELPVKKSKKPREKKSKSRSKKILILLVVFLIVIFLASNIKALEDKENGKVSIWTQFKHLILSQNKKIKGEGEDRINFLLLGMGGPGHDGPYLTDTIILASFKPSEKRVALLSIPRDLVMPIPGYGWRRINHANAFGELKNPGQGAELTVKTISQVFQLPIHYYLRVDFAGFVEFIDELDGIKVCVDHAFNDTQYPTEDYKTQTISFAAGCQMMDGETALKFVRSRHGTNGESSDFARSRRQQKVILAAKDKFLSFSTLSNPLTIKKLYKQYTDHIATNLEVWEMIQLAQLAKGISKNNIITQGLSDEPGGHLEIVIGEDNAFLLQPPGGNFDQIRNLVANIFGQPSLAEEQSGEAGSGSAGEIIEIEEEREKEKIKEEEQQEEIKEKAAIEIRNGTFIVGLAGRTQAYLQSLGYEVPTIGNTPLRDYQGNIIYSLANTEYPETVSFLKEKFNASISTDAPSWLTTTSTNDLVLILGQEAGGLEL